MINSTCSCGSLRAFINCCEPIINGRSITNTAEQLMRSRFTAFTLQDYEYLTKTHHPSKRHSNELQMLEDTSQQTYWINLIVHNTTKGLINDIEGSVEFSATFCEEGRFYELYEISQFTKEHGAWLYVDGQPTISPAELKFKRNEPCWCRSGKKFKLCHNNG